jgi:hypothetical protein
MRHAAPVHWRGSCVAARWARAGAAADGAARSGRGAGDMETSGTGEARGSGETGNQRGEAPDAYDLLDAIAAEMAAGVAVPMGAQVGLNAERMGLLIAALRAAASAPPGPRGEDARRVARREAGARATLMLEEARRKAELLLDGARVARLRDEEAEAIIDERRKQGEALVAAAYEYGQGRMAEVLRRAEQAERLVDQARDAVRPEAGVGQRIAGAARQIIGGRGGRGGLLGRIFPF